MAKQKQRHPLFMHVPTKIGFTIVGLTVMVYGLYLAAGYTANTQMETLQSHAAVPSRVPTPRPKKPAPTPIRHCYNKCVYFNIHLGVCTRYQRVCS